MNTSTLAQEKDLAQLATIVGSQHVRLEGADVFIAPENVEQIAETLRFASTRRAVITPVGGGTKQQWGNPVNANIRLDTTRLSVLREHAWQDMTCTVEAGACWASLQSELSKHGQMVALDPLWASHATVGGIIACNDSGAMRLRYGGLRDLIVGMTVVLSDGTIAKTGGKVVKNVAGYDLHTLMTGSFGTLAVIAQVNFRLHPIEQHARTWSIFLNNLQDGAAAFAEPLRKILDAQITPTSVQLRVQEGECALDVRVASLPAHLEEWGARLNQLAAGLRVVAAAEGVWNARERLFNHAGSIVLKISIPPTELCILSQEFQRVPEAELKISSVAQAQGLMTISAAGAEQNLVEFIHRLRERVRPFAGSVVVQQLPDDLRNRIDVWGSTSNPLPLMQEIKRQFDPDRLLNPGRFVGGI